ncbi:MAG: hypothetical protein U0929_09470 [Planctomycetaceae bacterium]
MNSSRWISRTVKILAALGIAGVVLYQLKFTAIPVSEHVVSRGEIRT